MGRIIPYIVENKKCLRPPTRHHVFSDICLIFSTPEIFLSSHVPQKYLSWQLFHPVYEYLPPPKSNSVNVCPIYPLTCSAQKNYPFIMISPRNVQVTQPFLQFLPSHIVLPADLGLNGLQGLQMLAGLGGGASPGGGRKGSARPLPLELRTNLCQAPQVPPGRGWIFDLNRDPW